MQVWAVPTAGHISLSFVSSTHLLNPLPTWGLMLLSVKVSARPC